VCRSLGNWRRDSATPVNTALVTIALSIAWLGLPADAAAQSERVFRTLASLNVALEGTYGDEGPEVGRLLDELSQALAEWDRSILETELRLRLQMERGPQEAAAAHEALGFVYLERSRFADAIAEFQSASTFAPKRASPHLLRGFALDAMGNGTDAGTAFHQAWTLDPDNPVATYMAIARSSLDEAGRNRVRDTLLSRMRFATLEPRARSPFFHPAAPADDASGEPVFPLARYADAFSLAMRGQIDQAILQVRKTAANDPLTIDQPSRPEGMRQAAAALRSGRLSTALTALEMAVKAAPGSSETHRMLGTVAAIGGDTAKSVDHLETAVRIRPDDERSWIALARTRADAGAARDAARTLEAAIAAIPGSGGLRWRYARLLVKLDRNADALDQYNEAQQRVAIAGRARLHQTMAAFSSLQQDLARTSEAVNLRLRVNLNDGEAHRDLASVYTKQGRQDEAFAELAIATWLDPDDALALVALGQCHMAAGRDADAIEALERAVAIAPNLREARYGLAQALTRAGKRADAQKQLTEFERLRTEAIARDRRQMDLEAIKGTAVRQSAQGQYRQSVETWKKVIGLEPDVAQNYRDLADALVKAGALEESLQYFVKTAELDGVADVHGRLADVLARLGRTRESALARETYERLRLEDFRRRPGR
jgi:tetratricopeptide (TPR) repeat protein